MTALSRLVLFGGAVGGGIAGIGGGIEGAVVPCVTGGDGAFKTGIVGGAVGGGIAGIGGGIEGAVVPCVTGGDGALRLVLLVVQSEVASPESEVASKELLFHV